MEKLIKEIKRRIELLKNPKLYNQNNEFNKGKIKGYENVLRVIDYHTLNKRLKI